MCSNYVNFSTKDWRFLCNFAAEMFRVYARY